MALQSPFFNKRDEPFNARPTQPGTAAMVTPNGTAQTASAKPEPQTSPAALKEGGGSKLTVGPNIKLKGVEITDCDTLVVEGLVEATMDSRVIQISEKGAFKGSAEIDIAEIHGEFDGNLTVRQKLVIFATGKVTGKIRYGKVVIEEGGQLSGEIEFGAVGQSKPLAANVSKLGLQAA
jgi:cytoskeletal protein CcmA (bactofilin family)